MPLLRRLSLGLLALVHALGILGAPYAASLHFDQPGASAHQRFHVIWEACKYASASLLALVLVVGPARRGERWAVAALAAGSAILFGGVFFADALTGGAPPVDRWSYGVFLLLSLPALAILWTRTPASEP
jgi:hypothetical protein